MNIYLLSLTDRGEAVSDTYTCIVVSVGRHNRNLHHANIRHIALLPVLGDTVGTYTIQADQTDVVQKLLIKDSSISTYFYLARKLQLFSIQSNYSRKFSFSGFFFSVFGFMLGIEVMTSGILDIQLCLQMKTSVLSHSSPLEIRSFYGVSVPQINIYFSLFWALMVFLNYTYNLVSLRPD